MTDRRAYTGTYVSGRWTLLCGERTWMLADIAEHPETLDRLWELLEAAADLTEVLAEIERAGTECVPSFALIHLDEGAERAVLRGAAAIRLVSAGVSVELSSPETVTKWLEYPVESRAVEVELSAGGGVGAESWLPISGGVALASAARLHFGAPQERVVPPRAIESLDQTGEGTEMAFAVPDSKPDTAPETSADSSAGHAAQYDFLFGETQRGTVEDAAVRDPEDDAPAEPPAQSEAESVDPAATLMGEPEASVQSSNGPESSAQSTSPPESGPGLIVAVPGLRTDQSAAERTTEPLEPGEIDSDVDDRTVTRARIDAIAEVGSDRPLGPVVKAVPCPNGHVNPPHNSTCRICGAEIGSATPITVPRPILGVLRLSTGDAVPLDRGAIIGRSPEATADREGERPHVVQVPSPDKDVSRNHVEIKLDGWHVLVTDLRSTNGTLVTVPGEQPQRLRPDEPFPIPPGTVVSLADEVTFVYEVGE